MKFIINYPENMTAPKGLFTPCLEDVQMAVRLAEIVVSYVDVPGYDSDDEFEVFVSDEVFVRQDILIDTDISEGVRLHPAARPWTVESVFEAILISLFGNETIIAISRNNLTEIAEAMKILINFIWNLQSTLPLVKDFCNEHEYLMDIGTTLSEKVRIKVSR